MTRTYNTEEVQRVMDDMLPEVAFCAEDWLKDERNIAITDGEENYNLLHNDGPGLYWGHTVYRVRGKGAVLLIRQAVKYAFDNFPVEVLMGLTPIEKKGARWLSRQAGFKSYGILETNTGPNELFILTRKEING